MEIDDRPSDAIAIGLRFSVPIYTYENILSEAGIVLSDFIEEEDAFEEKVPSPNSGKKDKDWVKNVNTDQLRIMLEESLAGEDYEKAAQIRDELNKRN